MNGTEDVCSSTAGYDAQCTVVNGRLTLYASELLTNPSELISSISTIIATAMNDGTLANSTTAIIRLHYLDGLHGIPLDSPLLSETHMIVTSWPAIVGAAIGVGIILLVVVGMRRYVGRKKEKTSREEIIDDDSVSIASHVSLSAIWNDKAMNELENARSFNDFVSSQPVIRLRSQPFSPQIASQRQDIMSVAMESAATRVLMKEQILFKHDHIGAIMFSSSDEDLSSVEDGTISKFSSSSVDSLSSGEGCRAQLLSSRLSVSRYSDSEYDYYPSMQPFRREVLSNSRLSTPSIGDFASTSRVAIFSNNEVGCDDQNSWGSDHYLYDAPVMSPGELSLSTLSSTFYK